MVERIGAARLDTLVWTVGAWHEGRLLAATPGPRLVPLLERMPACGSVGPLELVFVEDVTSMASRELCVPVNAVIADVRGPVALEHIAVAGRIMRMQLDPLGRQVVLYTDEWTIPEVIEASAALLRNLGWSHVVQQLP